MLLTIHNLTAGYGDVNILHGIDLEVAKGEIVTIAGTNGAGKSTLSKAVMGLVPRVTGSVVFNGSDITKVPAEKRSANKIAYVPQVANVFGSLTVLENLKVVRFVDNMGKRVAEMLALFPPLHPKLKQRADTLSGGERQMLAFARALMSDPALIVLDEPTAALAPSLVQQVFDLVKSLPERGVAVLMVEQRARQALAISDRGYILDQGRVVLSDRASLLLRDDRMARLYLGSDQPSADAEAISK